jgi:N-acetylglucosaminyldiphosphoundecaprenol N-acetyl-beta-D-mannosaminyltransferase
MPQTIKVLGSEVSLVDLATVRRTLADWVEHPIGRCRQMIVTGFHGLWFAHCDPAYRAIARAADLWVPDGIAPVAVARIKGIRGVRRTPGAEIMKTWLELADERGYSSYFYGDTEQTLAALKSNVLAAYPRHRVAGICSPPFRIVSEHEDREIVSRINDTKPDIVWVGLGLPKQDVWAFEHKDRLQARAVIGVGAAFGFLAGTIRRCPDWIGNHGLEWLYRFLMEPGKLWRRDLVDGPRFLWNVFLEQMGWKRFE